MKDVHEDAIDRVLTGLGRAEPHAGLEQRVRLGLERRQAEGLRMRPPVELWRRRATMWPGLAMVAAGVIVSAVLYTYGHQRERGSRPGPVVAWTAAAARIHADRGRGALESVEPAGGAEAGPREHEAVARLRVRATMPTAQDAGADAPVDAASLPSFPAPEAPLTEEEKLLVQIARQHDPAALAVLNSEQREEVAALRAEDFQQFFKPTALQEKIDELQAAELPPQK